MPSDVFAFGPYELDASTRRVSRHGDPVALSARQFDLLHLLVARAGQVLPKDALIDVAWAGVAVTDNSLEQAISSLRRLLARDFDRSIETETRRGYRFAAEVRRLERREPPQALDALLAPHRAWVEGRAALETLERQQILRARDVFAGVLTEMPDLAPAHVGLANAGLMQFEMTRAELVPDTAALTLAAEHAREACRLDSRYGEAWATLGFVLDRTGHRADALAASRRAVSLEPDNWRHHLRLGYVSWGEERLREARRTLALLPGFAIAHWLAATVYVARQAFDEAERELIAGLAAETTPATPGRFSAVALHWLLGLILLERGDEAQALAHFERELASEHSGQLYARECCASTWYAIGAVRLRRGERAAAVVAFDEALRRVPRHPLAHVGRRAAGGTGGELAVPGAASDVSSPELTLAVAAAALLQGGSASAIGQVDQALAAAPDGSALWMLPLDPLLQPTRVEAWAPVLARLRNRAA